MNLFIVVYLAGKIGATIGPIPLPLTECESLTVELAKQCTDKPTNPYACSELRFACEWHIERPRLDPAAGRRSAT